MSKFNLIAVAIAATLAAPSAFAITVNNDGSGTPAGITAATTVADIDIKDATTVVALGAVNVYVSPSDLIIGRTVGFSVRVDLQAGATFGAVLDNSNLPTVGAALPGATNGWTVSKAAGGTASDGYVVYSVQPGSGSTGVINGLALSFAADTLKVKGVAGLATADSTVSAKVTFADPGTAQAILTPVDAIVAKSASPLVYAVTGGDTASKIDVGMTSATGSKTRFSPDGSVANATPVLTFAAGTLKIGVPAAPATVINSIAASGTPFAWAGTDKVALTVNGTFNAFTTANGGSVVLVVDSSGTCAAPGTAPIAGVVTAGSVTFPAATTYSQLNSGGAILCFTAKTGNTTIIDATSVATQVTVTRATSTKTASANAAALPMAYNGANEAVWNFNPASNPDQQSYLRVTNTSTAPGLLTIAATCDSGVAQPTVASVTLGKGESKLLTSGDIENGNAAKGVTGGVGSCGGKSSLLLTGEFGTMRVQNFLRNTTSAGLINTNVNNQK